MTPERSRKGNVGKPGTMANPARIATTVPKARGLAVICFRTSVPMLSVERERVTERDEVAGFFRAHHAGEDRGLKDRAFFRGDLAVTEERGEGGRE